MSYSIEWDQKAFKFLDKLQKDLGLRILDKLEEIKENPFRYLEHYEGEGYKLRIGDYRALIDVDSKKRILFVRVLDKRGRIYKK